VNGAYPPFGVDDVDELGLAAGAYHEVRVAAAGVGTAQSALNGLRLGDGGKIDAGAKGPPRDGDAVNAR